MDINVLIRTSNRPKGFRRLLNTIPEYAHLVISVDRENDYVKKEVRGRPHSIVMLDDSKYYGKAYYNLYFNDMYSHCKPGFIHHIDDDDFYINFGFLEECKDPNSVYMFPYKKGNKVKPKEEKVICGKVGTPNIVVHTSMNLKGWTGDTYGDYCFIKNMTDNYNVIWKKEVLCYVPKRNFGKMEDE